MYMELKQIIQNMKVKKIEKKKPKLTLKKMFK